MQALFVEQAEKLNLSFSVQGSVKSSDAAMGRIQERLFLHMNNHGLAFVDDQDRPQRNHHDMWTFMEVHQKQRSTSDLPPPLHIVSQPWRTTFRDINTSCDKFSALVPIFLDEAAPSLVIIGMCLLTFV